MNQKEGKPLLAPETVNKYLSALGAFSSRLGNHGFLDTNPIEGLLVRVDKDRGVVQPYTVADLNAVFASPLYDDCRTASEWRAPGDVALTDHRFWLPVLALFTGARSGELAQLGGRSTAQAGDIRYCSIKSPNVPGMAVGFVFCASSAANSTKNSGDPKSAFGAASLAR